MVVVLSLLIKFQNQHKILSNLCYIIHQKIEKDNDKLFYFQHNLSDFGISGEKKPPRLAAWASLSLGVRQVRQVRPVR